jgi:hypothetical protein
MDIGKGREQGCGSLAYMDIGKGREHDSREGGGRAKQDARAEDAAAL